MPKWLKRLGAGEGNRTLVISLEGCCSTIELHPHREPVVKSQQSGLARRPPAEHTADLETMLVGEVGLEPTKP